MIEKMNIREDFPEKEQDVVEELVEVTEVMVEEINNLVLFLRKGKNPEEDRYFSITEEQRSEEWHE